MDVLVTNLFFILALRFVITWILNLIVVLFAVLLIVGLFRLFTYEEAE